MFQRTDIYNARVVRTYNTSWKLKCFPRFEKLLSYDALVNSSSDPPQAIVTTGLYFLSRF